MKRPHATCKSAAGFTVTEAVLLAGIIAVICALLFSALGRMRETSGATKCLMRLRESGFAMALSANDNRGNLVLLEIRNTKGYRWNEILRENGYLLKDEITVCPLVFPNKAIRDRPGLAYGSLGNALPHDPYATVAISKTGEEGGVMVNLNRLQDRSSYWLLTDSWDKAMKYQIFVVRPSGSSDHLVHLRHNGRANVLFADLHVEPCDGGRLSSLSVNPFRRAFSEQLEVLSF